MCTLGDFFEEYIVKSVEFFPVCKFSQFERFTINIIEIMDNAGLYQELLDGMRNETLYPLSIKYLNENVVLEEVKRMCKITSVCRDTLNYDGDASNYLYIHINLEAEIQ